MADALDMSLDAIIQKNKRFGGGGDGGSTFRGRRSCGGGVEGRIQGRGDRHSFDHAPGPIRRFPNRVQSRTAPYFTPQTVHREEFVIGEGSDIESGTKLYISNLDYGVTSDDIKVLFSDIGDMKRYSIHYDQSGRSKGTAEVVFASQSDAFTAVKRYNNVKLDGKRMKIEMVGLKLVTAAVTIPPTSTGILENPVRAFQRQVGVSGTGRDHSSGRVRGHGLGRGHGGYGRGDDGKMSTEDLDADLERYHQQARRIN